MLLKILLIVAAAAIVFFIIKKCGCGCGTKGEQKKDEGGEKKSGCCS